MVATKIYKKCSPHGRLYLYLGQRDFISSDGLIEDIKGIAYTPELSEIQGEKPILAIKILQIDISIILYYI